MIHRKFSFFVLFAIALALTFYTSGIRWFGFLLVCTGIVTAGAGVTFLVQNDRKGLKQKGIFLIACTLGIAFGFSLSARVTVDRAKVFTGLRITRISSFTGVCIKDSVPAGESGFIHYIDLIDVQSDVLKASAGARGRVVVISKPGVMLFTGEKVSVKSGISPAGSGEDRDFICYAGNRDIARTGYSFFLFQVRQNLHTGLVSLIETMGFPASALFKALFLGIREDLPPDLYNGFEKTGTLHILALSGLHAGIIYALVSLLLFFLPWPWMKYSAGFCVILFYLFIVGPKPSLVRATVMIIIFGTCYLLSLEREPLNLLGIACSLILIADPVSAYSLSFQLSFLAMAGIIIISPPVAAFFKKYLPPFIALPFSLSIGAQAGTAPIVFLHFGTMYPSGIIVTLLLIPFVTVFLWGGIIFLFLNVTHFPFIRESGEFIFSPVYGIMAKVTSFFSKIPGITLQWKWWHWVIFLMCMIPFLFPLPIIRRSVFIPEGCIKPRTAYHKKTRRMQRG
ncbi:MAG: ComEC/Rec2 family competence protein [Spirochaetales bacterium]|nr:ComEC/Rec2 family competence protein [Spirochaetales bacterium]